MTEDTAVVSVEQEIIARLTVENENLKKQLNAVYDRLRVIGEMGNKISEESHISTGVLWGFR